MTSEDGGEADISRPPPKKSFFRKPAWATAVATASAAPPAITTINDPFSRTQETYAQIKDQEARKKERKAAKRAKADAEERDWSATCEEKDGYVARRIAAPSKRIRLSSEDVDEATGQESAPYDEEDDKRSISISVERSRGPEAPRKSSTRSPPSRSKHPSLEPSSVIDLLDRYEEAISQPDSAEEASTSSPVASNQYPNNREQYVEVLDHLTSYDSFERCRSKENTPRPVSSAPLLLKNTTVLSGESAPQSPADPTLNILISSRIPNTGPLIASRKLLQRLKEVRVVWCSRQDFDHVTAAAVFLTFRGRRIFDFQSCHSLGVTVDEFGDLHVNGRPQPPGEEHAQLHMEAMTQQIFDEDKRRRLAGGAEHKASGASPDTAASAEETSTIGDSAKLAPGIKIVLKSPGFEEYKLVVKPASARTSQRLRLATVADPSIRQRRLHKLSQRIGSSAKLMRRRQSFSCLTARRWRRMMRCRTLKLATWMKLTCTSSEME